MSRTRRRTWKNPEVKSERRREWVWYCRCGRCETSCGLRKDTVQADLDDVRDLVDDLPSRRVVKSVTARR